jgi:3-hydroxyacyl-CoA dehydrogenase
MPTFLLSLAGKLGIPEPLRKAAVIGTGILLLILAAFIAVKIHDHRVIKAHQAAQDAANAKADRKADQKAAEQRRADDTRLTQESNELNRSTDHAQTNHDRSSARFRCIKLQQDARAAKRKPPAC